MVVFIITLSHPNYSLGCSVIEVVVVVGLWQHKIGLDIHHWAGIRKYIDGPINNLFFHISIFPTLSKLERVKIPLMTFTCMIDLFTTALELNNIHNVLIASLTIGWNIIYLFLMVRSESIIAPFVWFCFGCVAGIKCIYLRLANRSVIWICPLPRLVHSLVFVYGPLFRRSN